MIDFFIDFFNEFKNKTVREILVYVFGIFILMYFSSIICPIVAKIIALILILATVLLSIKYIFINPKIILICNLFYSMFIKYIITISNIPYAVNYISDLLNVFVIISIIYYIFVRRSLKFHKHFKVLCLFLGILFVFHILGFIINDYSILQLFWGMRNLYRFYIFLFGCIIFLTKEDIYSIFEVFLELIPYCLILCFIQLFILHNHPDNVGGIFGVDKGCNGYLNIYLCLTMIYALFNFYNHRFSIKKLGIISILLITIALLSELKYFYIEFVLFIVIYYILFDRNKKANLKYVFGGFIVIFSMIILLYILYPDFNNFFSLDYMYYYLFERGYSLGEGQLNRLTCIQQLTQGYITEPLNQWIGIGLGNADTSNFSFLNSNFYQLYGVQLSYTWFMLAMLFIETGYIGIILYLLPFVYILCVSVKENISLLNNKKNADFIFCALMIFAVFMQFFYNSSLRNEAAYMIYFGISLFFVLNKEKLGRREGIKANNHE